MDWYRTVRSICDKKNIAFVTDLIESEGFEKIANDGDKIIELFVIDGLLFRNPSRYGDAWRNLVKLIVAPLQIMRLKKIAKRNPHAVFHALPMYYMFLCWLAKIPYVGTPQGSEILVRPRKSKLYRHFASNCLSAAKHVTVDSVSMQDYIFRLCGKKAVVIQNGIDVESISSATAHPVKRDKIVSIRGFSALYRIDKILDGRDNAFQPPNIHFIYPFEEGIYKAKVSRRLCKGDVDLGRLPKIQMYELLHATKLAISIPASDSSPRSVYEAIFCGCCVAATYNPWIDVLPDCMKSRIYIVELDDKLWFEKSLEYAELISKKCYTPSEAALNLFDEKKSMQIAAKLLYSNAC